MVRTTTLTNENDKLDIEYADLYYLPGIGWVSSGGGNVDHDLVYGLNGNDTIILIA